MDLLPPGVPTFEINYQCFFVRCGSRVLLDELCASLAKEAAKPAFGPQEEHVKDLTARLIKYNNSEWTAILPVGVMGSIRLEEHDFLTAFSLLFRTKCVFLGIYDTAGGLIYRLARDGELLEELVVGEEEDNGNGHRYFSKSNPNHERAVMDPFSYVDAAFRDDKIIIPLPIRYEKPGNILLPLEELIQGHQEIEDAYVIELK